MQFLNQALGMQGQAMMAGLPIVQPQNIYETSKELWKEMGYRDTSRFSDGPARRRQKGPPPPPRRCRLRRSRRSRIQERDQIKAQADTIRIRPRRRRKRRSRRRRCRPISRWRGCRPSTTRSVKALETQYQMQMDAFRASKGRKRNCRWRRSKAAVGLESARLQAGLAPTEDDPSDRMRALAASVGKLARIVRQPRQLVRRATDERTA